MVKKYTPYQDTNVSVSKSQNDIRKLLEKNGCVRLFFNFDLEDEEVVLAWERKIILDGETVRQPLAHHLSLKGRKESQVYRALFYHLKAKFEAVEFQIVTFEEEFLPYFVVKLPDGSSGTIAEYFVPELKRGGLPPMQPLDNPQLTNGDDNGNDYEILDS